MWERFKRHCFWYFAFFYHSPEEVGLWSGWFIFLGLHGWALLTGEITLFLTPSWLLLHGVMVSYLVFYGRYLAQTGRLFSFQRSFINMSFPVVIWLLDVMNLSNAVTFEPSSLRAALLWVAALTALSLEGGVIAGMMILGRALHQKRSFPLMAKVRSQQQTVFLGVLLAVQSGWVLGGVFGWGQMEIEGNGWETMPFFGVPGLVLISFGAVVFQAIGLWGMFLSIAVFAVSERLLMVRLLTACWCGLLLVEFVGVLYLVPQVPDFSGAAMGRSSWFFSKWSGLLKVQWPVLLWVGGLGMVASVFRKQPMNLSDDVRDTTGSYGTAQFAKEAELEALQLTHEKTGLYGGGVTYEKKQTLFLPLFHRLILAPPGLWKSTTTSIPALLSYQGPCFVFDVKGELWAVTARYRHQTLKRKVVAIDPFGLTCTAEFAKGKPDELLQEWSLNPFDWIPVEERARDRVINAFASSFVVNEGSFAKHFDENARILIRGYMDYLMRQPPEMRSLHFLFELMSEPYEQAEATFQEMVKRGGRASASASQILRVGADERGSILSTSYRQMDWLSDSNIQKTLTKSNFDLRDFVKGNLDIYVILPEDQVKEHHRLMRMMLALLMSMIVQTPPSQLPKQKMLFLLDELAQLGYMPDVEQCIEVLRARGVVVWAVFQTLSQIEQFEKPDLFKGAAIKHIFTNDDTKTMEWIQTLAAKKTIRTKTLSINRGDSKQKMQIFGGSVSTGAGESVQETGVDLIPLNQIRELPFNEQFIFIQGHPPIHAYKQRYFEHPLFEGRFDENPVEQKRKEDLLTGEAL